MRYRIFLLVFHLTIFCSCKHSLDNKNVEHVVSITESNVLLDAELYRQLKIEALNGDTMAYNELSGSYADKGVFDEFLFVSITVANRYKNSQAMFDVYQSLSISSPQIKMDSITQSLALFYLLKSYESGYVLAKIEVESLFMNQKIPSSTFYLDDYKMYLSKMMK